MTTALWNFAGAYPVPLIAGICVVSAGITTLAIGHVRRDKRLLEQGGYAIWTGAVGQYTTVEISGRSRRGFDQIGGLQPTLHERDQLVVDGRVFFVQCERPPGTSTGTVGKAGQCLQVPIGRRVRVDYVQVSPTQYRAEPLRIWLLDQ